jgi:hypothetical protein
VPLKEPVPPPPPTAPKDMGENGANGNFFEDDFCLSLFILTVL